MILNGAKRNLIWAEKDKKERKIRVKLTFDTNEYIYENVCAPQWVPCQLLVNLSLKKAT